jgi:hypothetical protein
MWNSEDIKQMSLDGSGFERKTKLTRTLIAAPSSINNNTSTRDPEMHQTKKGNQWHQGMKAHIGSDADHGLVHSVVTTAANTHDITQAHALLHGEETVAGSPAVGPLKRSGYHRLSLVETERIASNAWVRESYPGRLSGRWTSCTFAWLCSTGLPNWAVQALCSSRLWHNCFRRCHHFVPKYIFATSRVVSTHAKI